MICHECGQDHTPSWADLKFGCVDLKTGVRELRQGVRIKGRVEYREDLARSQVEIAKDPAARAQGWRPGQRDPQAFVDSQTAVRRLVDQRKREGWVVDPDLYSKALRGYEEPVVNSEDMIREAYREAAESGFSLEDED